MEVENFAKMMKNNIVKKVANCKLLAERDLNYEISQIREQVLQNLKKYQDFFETTYKGFYCTICNFDNHKYFDMASQTIFFSEQFCRNIAENTLPTLLLFHVDIVKLANLVLQLVTSCDFIGTYNLDAVLPSSLTFSVVNDNLQNLQACRDNRNKPEWFSYCKDVCTNFNINSFSDYFQPNLKLVNALSAHLTTALNRLNAASASRPLLGALSTPTGSKRVLQETKVLPLFKPGLSAKIDLMKWKSDFLNVGISLYEEGKNSLINESTFKAVKSFLQIQAAQQSSAQVNPGQILNPQMLAGNTGVAAPPAAPVTPVSSAPKSRRLQNKSSFVVQSLVSFLLALFLR